MFSNKEIFKSQFTKKVASSYGKTIEEATPHELYMVLGTMIREEISANWIQTNKTYKKDKVKQAYYFSLEFLMGRMMGMNLMNMKIYNVCQEGLKDLGINLEMLEEEEPDAGLGNGGLGRLAACFLDALASLNLPGHGCGIRYRYGLFRQRIVDGYQVELPDNWLKEGNVWEIRRLDKAVEVRFYGHVSVADVEGRFSFEHHDYESVLAVPYDMPMIGYDTKTVNTLRLWNAEMFEKEFNPQEVGNHDQRQVIEYKRSTEAISELLYPDDSQVEGRVLRLKQQYFLVSAGLQSILRSFRKAGGAWQELPERVAIHINDTHPVLVIPELMRILMDEEELSWEQAWEITTKTVSFTNHTTLAEALETWPVDMVQHLLPRIYMIIEEIDRRFIKMVQGKTLGRDEVVDRVRIVHHGHVRMAHLAVVASYSVNGVAKLHTEILKKREMKDFYRIFPNKFNNKTNGITHRRWLLKANPVLANLVTETVGTGWIHDPEKLSELAHFADDSAMLERIGAIKRANKEKLAGVVKEQTGLVIDPSSIYDVQVKRLHAYKRQVLNALHIMDLYDRLREDPTLDLAPRTFIFAAKAAPSYYFAKKVIKLINSLAEIVNNDPAVKDRLKVVFLENYSVSLAEKIIPAADVSEQISTASKEASGTGNMKFMMNGAVTLGTLDGANIEIEQAVGEDNIFIFGLTANEVLNYYEYGGYSSFEMYNTNPRVRRVVDQLVSGRLGDIYGETRDIYNALLGENDQYFVLRDFCPYAEAQDRVDTAFGDTAGWNRRALINIARSGGFSGDRTIREYADEIWKIKPVKW